jgi:hypothetical protein
VHEKCVIVRIALPFTRTSFIAMKAGLKFHLAFLPEVLMVTLVTRLDEAMPSTVAHVPAARPSTENSYEL